MGKRTIYIHASERILKSLPVPSSKSKVTFVLVPIQQKIVYIHPDPEDPFDLTDISSIEHFSNSHDDVVLTGD
jgi:hypothetical protein